MPLTFDARVQRSLATHTPAESLVAAARPLSHEIRTDGPMGVVSQLMRVVDEPTALAAASMSSGADLVLRTRRMSPVELDADASLGTLAPSFSPSRAAAPSVAPSAAGRGESAPAAGGESAPGGAPIAPAADAATAPEVTIAGDDLSDRDVDLSDRDVEQPVRQIMPRAAPSSAPTLAAAPVLTGAVRRWTATDVATPLRSLQTAVASSGEAGGVPSPAGFASLTLAPPIPSAAAPSATPPNRAGRTAPVARSADPSTSTSPTPLVGRRRHVVEVKSVAEADLAVLRVVDPSNAGASNPMGSDPAEALPSESLRSESLRSDASSTREASAGSADDADDAGGSWPITRAADVAASADPPVAPEGPPARPTLGRRPGLGMPMHALPASAIGVQRESDPFAGWNDAADPLLLLADRGATPAGPESGTEASGTAASASLSTAASSTEAPSGSVHRAVDAQPVSTGSAFELPVRASAEPAAAAAAAAVRGAEDAAFDADASAPLGDTGTGVLLQPVAASAPTLGTRSLQRVVDDRSSVSVIGGAGSVTTTVPVQWLVGAGRGVPSGSGSGGGAPAIDRVDDQGMRSAAGSGGGGPIGGSGAGGSTVSRSPVPGNSDAPSFGASDPAAALARPPSSAVESATPAGDDALAVIRRLPSAPLPPTDASGSTDGYRSGDGNGSRGGGWGGTFPGAVVPTEGLTGLGEGAHSPGGDSADQARASSPGALRTLSRVPGEAASTSLPVVSLARFPADSNALQRASGSGSASVSGGGPLPVASIGTSTTIARRAEGMAAVAVPGVGGAGSSGGGGGWPRGSGEDGAPEPSAQDGVESSFVFREADAGAAASSAATPAAAGEGGATAGAAAQADSDMDKLAATLYERLRQRLRRELLDDRERAGFALDRVR